MNSVAGAIAGSVGTVAVFGFFAFAVWINYRKEKDQRETKHLERMKALELGHPPLDAELARARAYASAAWAAALVGLLVPIFLVSLTVVGTIVAVLHYESDANIAGALIVAWSIAGGIALVTILGSLNVIRRLPRPTAEAAERRPHSSSAEFQERLTGL